MVLVTGANGFIGNAIINGLRANQLYVRGVVRSMSGKRLPGVEYAVINGMDTETDWTAILYGIAAVIHTAARVHITNGDVQDSIAELRRVNVDATLSLARQSAVSGVRRFIFISSIKVNGQGKFLNHPYDENDIADPVDPYEITKYETEIGLYHLASKTKMDVVIIRPPLVYGPGVKANFLSMMKWIYKGIPLPLGSVHNKRSLVALDNLVDLIVTCVDHPAAANQTFMVSDGEDLSTTELLQRMGEALGKPARLFPVPIGLLKTAATLIGKRDMAQRLLGSLQVDISKTREVLGWIPPVSVDEGLKRTAHWYLQNLDKV